MKNTPIKFLTLALLGLLLFGTFSCDDKYTEEDALKAQQEIDLTIYVVNGSSTDFTPVQNAKVVISQAGATREVTTDATGLAQFPKIKVGGYTYSVTAENFTSQHGTENIDVDNFRQAQVTHEIVLHSLSDENAATIRGTVIMEKDMTNLTPEPADGIKIFFDVWLDGDIKTFFATTDASGNYEIKLPTQGGNSSTEVSIRPEEFEADQTIAINKYSDEVGSFYSNPQVLPRLETIPTVFSLRQTGWFNFYYDGWSAAPEGVRSLYAVAEAPPAGGTRAIISSVATNSLGQVTGISFHAGGNYTGDTDSTVSVTIVSLDGGSGASIEIALAGNSDASVAYATPANRTITPGSGYPAFSDNFTLNKIWLREPEAVSDFNVSSGNIHYVNIDYGTGIARPREIVGN